MTQLYQKVLSDQDLPRCSLLQKLGVEKVTCTHVFCGTIPRATLGNLTARAHGYIAQNRYLQYTMTSTYHKL